MVVVLVVEVVGPLIMVVHWLWIWWCLMMVIGEIIAVNSTLIVVVMAVELTEVGEVDLVVVGVMAVSCWWHLMVVVLAMIVVNVVLMVAVVILVLTVTFCLKSSSFFCR